MNHNDALFTAASEIIEDCSKLKSRLGIQVLIGSMTGETEGTGLSDEELNKIEGAIMWIMAVAPELSGDSERAAEILDFAAETFEFICSLQKRSIQTDEIPLSVYSAILYASQCKLPNARIVSSTTDEALVRNLKEVKTLSDLLLHLLFCLRLLAAGDFFKLQEDTTINENARSFLQNILETHSDHYREFATIVMAYEALRLFTVYAISGDQTFLAQSEERLNKAHKFARSNSFLAEIVRHVSLVFDAIAPNLTVKVLEPFTDILPSEYQSLLIHGKEPIFLLWPPQRYALQQGFLSTDHIAISMPTSAGKTLLAEMKIASELGNNPEALIFYVVPLNALARQIQKSLWKRLRLNPLRYNIKVLTGTYEIEDSDLALSRKENVIITTPEKLDGLLRNIDHEPIRRYFERCCLFIFDECHSVGDGKRGITYEFLIARLRNAFPSAKTLALSAAFSNIEDFAQWIAQDKETSRAIQHLWRPTNCHWATWSETEGFGYEGTWFVQGYKRSSDRKADAARLAIDMQQAYENVLIIAESRDSCEAYAAALAKTIKEIGRGIITREERRILNSLSKRVRKEILGESKLADWIEQGIAYHHGHLPANVRAAIEDCIESGTLKFVVATTTLSEGVNFPIRCVILPNIWIGPLPLPAIKLRNIIGRAGRAHISTSGQAVVFKKYPTLRSGNGSFNFDKYCFDPPEQLTRVTSALMGLLDGIVSSNQMNIQQALESQLLAFLALEGMQADDQAEKIVATTYIKAAEPGLEKEAVGFIKGRMEAMTTSKEPMIVAGSPYQLTKYGKQVLKTGFGLRDASLLTELLKEIATEESDYFSCMGVEDRLDRAKIRRLLLLALTTLESQLGSFGLRIYSKDIMGEPISKIRSNISGFIRNYDTNNDFRQNIDRAILSIDVELIWRWINGATPQELGMFLSESYKRLEDKLERATIEAIHIINNAPYSINWPLYSIRLLHEFLLKESVFEKPLSPQFDNLPYYIKHGVAHPMAVMLMEKVKDRDFRRAAMKIATGYNVEVSFVENRKLLLQSLLDLGEEGIAHKIDDEERASKLWAKIIKS